MTTPARQTGTGAAAPKAEAARKPAKGAPAVSEAPATKADAAAKKPAKAGPVKAVTPAVTAPVGGKPAAAKKKAVEPTGTDSAPATTGPADTAKAGAAKAGSTKAGSTKAGSTKAGSTKAGSKPAGRKDPRKGEFPTTWTTDDGEVLPLAPPRAELPAVAASAHFDAPFLESQRSRLLDERARLVGAADRLEAEAEALADGEMGDVQFDDESGEGDTLVVERERDLVLSAQNRQTIELIDAALDRLMAGTYGLSLISGRPIPAERLYYIPWATELVQEKVGGLGRR